MANFQSGLFTLCRSNIGRAFAISLVLHLLLVLQTLPGASSVRSRHGLTPSGNFLDVTLHGTKAPPAPRSSLPTRSEANHVRPEVRGTTAPIAHRQSPPAASPPDLSSGSAKPGEFGPVAGGTWSGRDPNSTAGSGATAALAGAEGVDADALRRYRLGLAVETRRFRRYPQEALEQGWSGTAQLRIVIAASGALESVQLTSSSGHAVLDAAALDMIQRAAPNAIVPGGLRGRPFSLPLPVEFRHDTP